MHTKMQAYSKALNKFYCDNKAFWQVDFDWNGFQWIDCNDNENSIVSFVRKAEDSNDFIIAVCNFTPEVRQNYRIGVPSKGHYVEVFNSDDEAFGGSGVLNHGEIISQDVPWHNREQSITLTVPPLATVYLRLKGQSGAGTSFPEASAEVDARGHEESDSASKAEAAEVKKTAGKKTSVKKTATKTAAKKTATKAAGKTTAKKTAVKAEAKATAKKASAKTAAKTTAKKTATKAEPKTAKKTTAKAATKTAAAKKTAEKKTVTAEKPAAKKTTARKATAAKTAAAKKTTKSTTTKTTAKKKAAGND